MGGGKGRGRSLRWVLWMGVVEVEVGELGREVGELGREVGELGRV